MQDLNINMEIPRGHLLLALMCLFFISGLVVGTLIGGYYVHNRWKEYDENYKEMIDKRCPNIEENKDSILLPINEINGIGG